ncbi:hypothetical protein AXW96_29800 [Pseudomonas aeruginosa]|nr:hypothetical protein AXW96_29800 [Pseudomonas aeruginosa]RIZ31866.1 hypothetical protein AXX01_28805 [Pseudomonas aeruginosa]
MGLAYHIEVFLKGLATLFWINAECGKLHGTIARGYSQEQTTSAQLINARCGLCRVQGVTQSKGDGGGA